jgi:hypothetical protein
MSENIRKKGHLCYNPIKPQSGNSPNDIIPVNDAEAINPNQKTENMETHVHDLHKAPEAPEPAS